MDLWKGHSKTQWVSFQLPVRAKVASYVIGGDNQPPANFNSESAFRCAENQHNVALGWSQGLL